LSVSLARRNGGEGAFKGALGKIQQIGKKFRQKYKKRLCDNINCNNGYNSTKPMTAEDLDRDV
jgi:hypothetical protein